MKRWMLIAVTLLTVLTLAMPGGVALAAGESNTDPIEVAEDQSFSVSLAGGYKSCYYTFTPQSDGLYAVIAEGNCNYYIYQFTEDWRNRVKTEWLFEGEDRFALGQLKKGVPVNISIMSYSDPLTVTARISAVPAFSYELLSDGTASISDVAVSGDVVIPQTIDGYKVTRLAGMLFYGRKGNHLGSHAGFRDQSGRRRRRLWLCVSLLLRSGAHHGRPGQPGLQVRGRRALYQGWQPSGVLPLRQTGRALSYRRGGIGLFELRQQQISEVSVPGQQRDLLGGPDLL